MNELLRFQKAFQIEKKHIAHEDGTKIYYETCMQDTSRPVIVLVHGIGGDVDGWRFVRDRLLADGLSTVALDVRGHGFSDHPRKASHYAIDRILEDIENVLDAEELARVVLVGHSGGAILSLQFALKYPERLSGLVLLAGSYLAPAYMRSKFTKRLARILTSAGAYISPPAMKPWHSTYPEGKFNKEYEPWGLLRTIAHNSLRSYLLVGRELMNIELEHRLVEIRIPTLLIAGEHDSIYPAAVSRVMHEKIDGSRLEIVADANHVLILNNAAESAAHIIDFVQNGR